MKRDGGRRHGEVTGESLGDGDGITAEKLAGPKFRNPHINGEYLRQNPDWLYSNPDEVWTECSMCGAPLDLDDPRATRELGDGGVRERRGATIGRG